MILTHPCSSILDNERPIENEKRPTYVKGLKLAVYGSRIQMSMVRLPINLE